MMSQFHFGSIQTIYSQRESLLTMEESQFHFGSIQTEFKSTPVSIGGKTVSIPLWFNSNETFVKVQINKDNTLSQFHFGSIQTKTMARETFVKVQISLNSTLVQFKRRYSIMLCWISLCLNSTLVQFKQMSLIIIY